MNNFILNLLGIEDDNVIVDDFFNEKETNTLVVTISLKRKQELCPKCGSICTHIHSQHTKKINHSQEQQNDHQYTSIIPREIKLPLLWKQMPTSKSESKMDFSEVIRRH